MDNCRVLRVELRSENQRMSLASNIRGKGIGQEILPRIFDPFFTTKPAGEGTALGLNIVKKVVEKHSGKIEVTWAIGQRTFTVSIAIAI